MPPVPPPAIEPLPEAGNEAGNEQEAFVLPPVVAEAVKKAARPPAKGEKGFEKWLKALSFLDLQMHCESIFNTNADARQYVQAVADNENMRVCSKCRFTHGCEKCTHEGALRYVLRWGKPASWWHRQTGKGFKAPIVK